MWIVQENDVEGKPISSAENSSDAKIHSENIVNSTKATDGENWNEIE
jgi:hypothetical protein